MLLCSGSVSIRYKVILIFFLLISLHSISSCQNSEQNNDTLSSNLMVDSTTHRDSTFFIAGNAIRLTKGMKRILYFDFRFKKEGDVIRKIQIDDQVVYDGRAEISADGEIEFRSQEKYEKVKGTINSLILTDYLRLKGRAPFLKWTERVTLTAEFLDSKPNTRTIQLIQGEKFKPYYDLTVGVIGLDDSAYQEIKHSYGYGRALGYYQIGLGLKKYRDRLGVSFLYSTNDDKESKTGVKLRNRIYWWEIYTYYSRILWLSYDKNLAAEFGFKAAKLRGFFSEDSLSNGIQTHLYNFSKFNLGPAIGLKYRHGNADLGMDFSWPMRGYLAFHFGYKLFNGKLGAAGPNIRLSLGKDLFYLGTEWNFNSVHNRIYNEMIDEEDVILWGQVGILAGLAAIIYAGSLMF